MSGIETIKNRLIDRIMATRNRKLLEAIDVIFSSQKDEDATYMLSFDQIEILEMSEEDIAKGRLVSESELEKQDKEWLG